MFASCIDDLARTVDRCVIECDPRLVSIFERSFPRCDVYPHLKKDTAPWLNDGIVPTAKTWLGSLPRHYRRHREAFPERRGYLAADPRQVDAWRARLAELGPGLKVGISWRGGTPSTRRSARSIPLVEWEPLLRQPGAHFIDLQYGDAAADIETLAKRHGLRLTHWPDALTADYDATAALVEALDLVISVQTSVVHLAGALGKDAWVLVPRVPEWRYGVERRTMPWYPSVRMFRQTTTDWTQCLMEAANELRAKVDHLRHSAGTYL
jgi:ADP-heptose:LPS heptosyltransferase